MQITNYKKYLLFLAILFIIPAIVFSHALYADFLIDDSHLITNNIYITNPSYFGKFFTKSITSYPMSTTMFRPLLMLSFAFNYMFSHLNPAGYRLINIIIHCLNGIILFFLLKKINPAWEEKFLIAISLLFALHPLNSEAVVYISARSDILLTSFILLGVLSLFYSCPAIAIISYGLALMTKETALTFPMLAAICLIFKDGKLTEKNKKIILSLLILTIVYLGYRHLFFLALTPGKIRSFGENILLQTWATINFIRLIFLPYNLNIIHLPPENYSNLLLLLIFIIILILFLVASRWFIKKNKANIVGLGILWVYICILPFFYARLYFIFSEHRFYLASIGMILILTGLMAKKPTKAIYFIIIILSLITWLRLDEYTNKENFWQTTLKREPKSVIAACQLSNILIQKKQFQKAQIILDKALKYAKKTNERYITRQLLTISYLEQNQIKEALLAITPLLKIIPPPLGTLELLGDIFFKQKEKNQALTLWLKEYELYPHRPSILLKLAKIFIQKQEFSSAEKYLNQILTIPSCPAQAYIYLGYLAESKGNFQKALAIYKKAQQLYPENYLIPYYTSRILIKLGQLDLAANLLNRCLYLNAQYAPAHHDLAVIYSLIPNPDWPLACSHAQEAKKLGYKLKLKLKKALNNHCLNKIK